IFCIVFSCADIFILKCYFEFRICYIFCWLLPLIEPGNGKERSSSIHKVAHIWAKVMDHTYSKIYKTKSCYPRFRYQTTSVRLLIHSPLYALLRWKLSFPGLLPNQKYKVAPGLH